MLKLVDIRKTYRLGPVRVEVLRGLSLDVARGDMVSVMGPSGSGKSTLMNIVGLLDRPTSGSYRLEGREISAMNDNDLSTIRNAKIGFVFQSFHLLPRLTAEENVGIPLVYRGMSAKQIRLRTEMALDRVGMRDRLHHRPRELSGGQQQRVAIARALAAEPAILLADEPTGALDSRIGQDIMRLFRRLNEEEKITIVIITHDPSVARQCRRQTRIGEGLLHEDESPPPGNGRGVR